MDRTTAMDANPDSLSPFSKRISQFPRVALTRPGMMYLTVNVILMLTAINYSNHNILVIALFLLSLFAAALLMSVRSIRAIQLQLEEIRPVFLGQEASVPVRFRLRKNLDSYPVEVEFLLESGRRFSQTVTLSSSVNSTQIPLSPGARGRYKLIEVRLSSTFPLGLVRMRRSFPVAQAFWIYAKPADEAVAGARMGKHGNDSGDDVFLRQYRMGDPVRRIHRKSLAMGRTVLVKDMEARAPDSQWLQWEEWPELPAEQRLQVLTRQVLTAEQQGRAYGLVLPNGKLSPGQGEAHKHQCLRLLAEV